MVDIEKIITETCTERYNTNLAAILLFGSYRTGQFREGMSDVDSIILLKSEDNIDPETEKKDLITSLSDIRLAVIHFTGLQRYWEHIYTKGSWSSWITVIKGSKVIYATPEFKEFREKLIVNPIHTEKLIEYLRRKDEFELKEGLEEKEGWDITKWLFSHFRRKLQIINYHCGNEPKFDYDKCLNNIEGILDNKHKLLELERVYNRREELNKKDIDWYVNYAKELTDKISQLIKG